MNMRILASGVAALMLMASPAFAQKQMGVGSKPPKLVDVDWLRGKPVKQFRRGTTYVVYFWATSGRNCARTVPLLEGLRDSHPKQRLELLGINIWSQPDGMPAETYLDKREGFMDFPIARDRFDKTARLWNKLVGLPSVPRVVIINRVGVIAWSGHPFDGVDVALDAILARDEEALAELVAARTELHEKAEELREEIDKFSRYKWWSKLSDQIGELIALDQQFYGTWSGRKYEALVFDGKHEEAASFGRRIVDERLVTCEAVLNEMAWFIVNPRGKVKDPDRDVELALRTASLANELSGGRDAGILDTLARAHHLSGNAEQALSFQQLAVEEAYSKDLRTTLEETLDEYRSDAGP